jgi:hypothetical protein
MAELRVKGTGTIKLFESDNTSSVTIASPASLTTDRTVTLPDGDVTLVAGTMSTGGGIENATLFRMTSDFTADVNPVINWEVNDTAGYGTLGSAVTESSGTFSFPATGYWLVQASAGVKPVGTDNGDLTFTITTTINDSSYVNQTMGFCGIKVGGRIASYNSAILDVTDVANVKVRFSFGGIDPGNCTVLGDTDRNETYALFIKLADT